jgi:hypothetical protein
MDTYMTFRITLYIYIYTHYQQLLTLRYPTNIITSTNPLLAVQYNFYEPTNTILNLLHMILSPNLPPTVTSTPAMKHHYPQPWCHPFLTVACHPPCSIVTPYPSWLPLLAVVFGVVWSFWVVSGWFSFTVGKYFRTDQTIENRWFS